MTPDMFERLQAQLAALEPEIKNMRGASPGFVRDQIARVASYGVSVRMSPKQRQWRAVFRDGDFVVYQAEGFNGITLIHDKTEPRSRNRYRVAGCWYSSPSEAVRAYNRIFGRRHASGSAEPAEGPDAIDPLCGRGNERP